MALERQMCKNCSGKRMHSIFLLFFSDWHSPLPSSRTQGVFQGIALTRGLHNAFPEPNPLIRSDAEFAKKTPTPEEGALPELLVEYFLPALSPKSAKAGLLQRMHAVLLSKLKFTGLKLWTLVKNEIGHQTQFTLERLKNVNASSPLY